MKTNTLFRFTCLLVLSLFAFMSVALMFSGKARADGIPIKTPCGVHVLSLGYVHHHPLYCQIAITSTAGDEAYMYDIAVKFGAIHDGKLLWTSTKSIEAFRDSITYQLADFTGAGRKQVLIEGVMGQVLTHIYDYNGFKVVSIYDNEGQRVGVTMVRRGGKRWCLQESWPANQFSDATDFNLGTAFYKGDHGIVRNLHWDGTMFTPDEPGDTLVVYSPNSAPQQPPM